jgi:hypothetical protein
LRLPLGLVAGPISASESRRRRGRSIGGVVIEVLFVVDIGVLTVGVVRVSAPSPPSIMCIVLMAALWFQCKSAGTRVARVGVARRFVAAITLVVIWPLPVRGPVRRRMRRSMSGGIAFGGGLFGGIPFPAGTRVIVGILGVVGVGVAVSGITTR